MRQPTYRPEYNSDPHNHTHHHHNHQPPVPNFDLWLNLYQNRKQMYLNAQQQVVQHQDHHKRMRLAELDTLFKTTVKPVLQAAQDSLHQAGYRTGLYEETQPFESEGDTAGSVNGSADNESTVPEEYVVGLSLHMSDNRVKEGDEPSIGSRTNNQIRFFLLEAVRDAGNGDIGCQFQTSKMQSQLLPLYLNHGDGAPAENIEALVQDFVSLVLLTQRSGLEAFK